MTSMNVFRKSTVTHRDALPHWLTGRAIGGTSILRKPVQRKRQLVGVHRLHRLHRLHALLANHWALPRQLCKVVLGYGYADLRGYGYGLRVKCCILEKYKIVTDHILKLSTIVPLMVLVLAVLVGRGNKTVAAQACEVNKHRPHVDVNMCWWNPVPGKHHSISVYHNSRPMMFLLTMLFAFTKFTMYLYIYIQLLIHSCLIVIWYCNVIRWSIRWVLAAPGILWISVPREGRNFLGTIESPLREEENLQVPRRSVEHGELHPSKHIQTLFELWTRSRTERLQCKSWWIVVNLVNHFIHVHTYTSFTVIPCCTSTSCFSLHGRDFWYFLPWPNWYSIDPPAARIKCPEPGPGHRRAILLLLELCWSKGSRSSCVFLANSIGSMASTEIRRKAWLWPSTMI